jgi:hypothetical protein
MFKYSISFSNGEVGSIQLKAESLDSPVTAHFLNVGKQFHPFFSKKGNWGLTPNQIADWINTLPFASITLEQQPAKKVVEEEVVEEKASEGNDGGNWTATFKSRWGSPKEDVNASEDGEDDSSEEKVGD